MPARKKRSKSALKPILSIQHAESHGLSDSAQKLLVMGNLPELSLKNFLNVDLSKYGWIHFECRNPAECCKMIMSIKEYCSLQPSDPITISLEIEKKQPDFMNLVHLADVLIISKDFARYCGYNNKIDAVTKIRNEVKTDAIVICPWGEDGAAATDKDGQVYSCPAYPSEVVDTLGAGDTFNAGLIHCLSNGKDLEDSIIYSCRLAGSKCGMLGYNGLKKINFDDTIS